ncbi:cell division protein sufI [Streptomyces laurentii]|uniref:Cell division protein sufI n=1 Tax=Streptomyces laurentii TaxID=39478 RepID=A0A161JV74_STRLU|nr:cell division protein sufI [Streptomyces laurentii]
MNGGHGRLIGGRPFDPARTDVTVGPGDVEAWRFIADVYHPIHPHLAGFRVLTRGGKLPRPTTPASRTPPPRARANPRRSSPTSTATAAVTSSTATTPNTTTWA